MASKFKFTEHTASEWASLTPAKNEYCIATETKTTLYKIGNGSYTYANLPFRSFEDFKNVNTNLPDLAKRETLKRVKDHIDVIDSLGVGGGTAQAQTITYTQDIVLTVGKQFTYTPSVSNTATAPTININGLGAKTVILGTNVASGTALIASDITINVPCIIIYDGTNFRLQNPQNTPAASVKVTPVGGIVATNVQNALAEIDGEVSELELKTSEKLGLLLSIDVSLNLTATSGNYNLFNKPVSAKGLVYIKYSNNTGSQINLRLYTDNTNYDSVTILNNTNDVIIYKTLSSLVKIWAYLSIGSVYNGAVKLQVYSSALSEIYNNNKEALSQTIQLGTKTDFHINNLVDIKQNKSVRIKSFNIYNKETATIGKYFNAVGEILPAASPIGISDLIPVNGKNIISNCRSGSNVVSMVVYDINGTFIRSIVNNVRYSYVAGDYYIKISFSDYVTGHANYGTSLESFDEYKEELLQDVVYESKEKTWVKHKIIDITGTSVFFSFNFIKEKKYRVELVSGGVTNGFHYLAESAGNSHLQVINVVDNIADFVCEVDNVHYYYVYGGLPSTPYAISIYELESIDEAVGNLQEVTKRPAILTFVDDDGVAESFQNWESISDKCGVKPTMAIVTSFIGNGSFGSWSEIERLQNKGFEFISHTNTHPILTEITEEQIITEFTTSISTLKTHGCNSKHLVYPGNARNASVISMAKKYFTSAIWQGDNANIPPLDHYQIKRYTYLDVTRQQQVEYEGQTYTIYLPKTDADLQTIIDNAIKNGGWVIFMCHFRNSYSDYYAFNQTFFDSVVSICKYAASKGVSLLPYGEAFNIYKNRLNDGNVGDTSYYVVDSDGIVHSNQ